MPTSSHTDASASLQGIQDAMRDRKRLLRSHPSAETKRSIRLELVALRRAFAEAIVQRMFDRLPFPIRIVRAQFALDARSIVELPIVAGQLVADRLVGRRGP
jgi:hypothetical protein